MSYYDKYIKYKKKYINLKNMIGSGRGIPEYYRCNNCNKDKIFTSKYKGKSKKICLTCENELQQVKYFQCPNWKICPIGGKGPFISPFLGPNPICMGCKAPLGEISKIDYDNIQKLFQETRRKLDSGKGEKSTSTASTSYKTRSLDLLKDTQVLISNIGTKENSELNDMIGVITGVNSDGTYIVNITEGASVSTYTIARNYLTPTYSYKKKSGKVSSDISSKFTLIQRNIASFIEQGLIDHNIIIKNLNIEGKPLILLSLNIAQKQTIDINKYPGNTKHQAFTKIRSKKELSRVKHLNSKLEKVGEFSKMLRKYKSQGKVKEFKNITTCKKVPQIIIEEETDQEYAERLTQILQLLFNILNDVDIPIIICLQEINPLTVFQGVFSSFYSKKFNLHHHDDIGGTHSVLIYSNDLSIRPINNTWLQKLGQQRHQKIMGYKINESMLELHNIHTTYFENKEGENNADIFLQKILKSFTGSNKIIVGDANLKLTDEEVNKWIAIYEARGINIEFIITPEIAYLEDDIDANPTYDVFISYLN